jgi:O-antigen/teichoic acid export membrane protein
MNLNISKLKHHLTDPLYRNSLFLMTSTAVLTGLGFFFWMVVARYYSEYEVGVSAAIISVINLLAIISSLGLGSAITRFLPKAENPVGMINSSFIICGIFALVVTGIFLAGIDVFSKEINFIVDHIIFLLAFVVFTVCRPITILLGAIFVAKRRAEFTLVKNSIFAALKIPLPILLVMSLHAFGIVGSWGIAASIALVVSLFIFLPRIQRDYKPTLKINWDIMKLMWKYSAGSYLARIFFSAPALILPIIIVNNIGPEHNAYFYVAWTISSLLFAISHATARSLFAEGSHFEERLAPDVRRSFKFIAMLLIPAMILVVLLGKWLLLLFGESYSDNALKLLWILAFSSPFIAVNSIYTSILRVQYRIKELIALRASVAITVLVASALITPYVGITGTGYVWTGIQALVSVYAGLLIRVRYRAMKAANKSFTNRLDED